METIKPFTCQLLNRLWMKTPVSRTRAVQTHSSRGGTGMSASAPASQTWRASRPTAAQSVSSTRTVRRTRPASAESARILVLDCVESMPTAESETIFPFVSATKDILEIRFHSADGLQVSWKLRTNARTNLKSWPQNLSKFCFFPPKFCGNPAGVSRKNFVSLMGLPTFYLDSWNYLRKNKYRKY